MLIKKIKYLGLTQDKRDSSVGIAGTKTDFSARRRAYLKNLKKDQQSTQNNSFKKLRTNSILSWKKEQGAQIREEIR